MINLLLLPLLPIIYEDLRYRAIHWFWVALFTILIISIIEVNWTYTFTNVLLILFQLLGLTIYFSLKHREATNIINRYLGLGDIIFFLPLCLLFSPLNFTAFLTISFIASILLFLVGKLILGEKLVSIPLAGYLSIFLVITLICSYTQSFSLTDDTWLLHHLMGFYF